MEINKECSICDEQYTDILIKDIICPYCNKDVCNKCYETRWLGIIDDPHCMFCKKRFSIDFIESNFSSKFLLQLKEHRKSILLSREISLLPQTQPLIENIRIKEKARKKMSQISDKIKILQDKKKYIYSKYILENKVDSKKSTTKYLWKCCKENCNGFVDELFTCPLCKTKMCDKCGEKCNSEHECDNNAKKSFTMVKNSSIPCPSCGTRISKSSGCNQMFCINCHTGFDYKTGKKTEGLIHNPHFFEWMRKGNNHDINNFNNNNCNELPQLIRCKYMLGCEICYKFDEILRIVIHMNSEITTPRLNSNEDLRIKYLLDEIDKEKWSSLLLRREKILYKKGEFLKIDSMFVETSKILFNNLKYGKDIKCDDVYIQFLELIEYYNQSQYKLGKKFDNKFRYLYQKSKTIENNNWYLEKISASEMLKIKKRK